MGRVPSLRNQSLERIIRRALLAQRGKVAAAYTAQRAAAAAVALQRSGAKHFQVVEFTIQADHLHLICEAPDKNALARGIAGLEIRIARGINGLLGRKGKFWKERYHRHDLRSKRETRNALRYVLLNSQKHIRHLGDRAFADPHSSAATFDGFARAVWAFPNKQPWAHVAPQTWLLRVGWRSHGLIDPSSHPVASVAG